MNFLFYLSAIVASVIFSWQIYVINNISIKIEIKKFLFMCFAFLILIFLTRILPVEFIYTICFFSISSAVLCRHILKINLLHSLFIMFFINILPIPCHFVSIYIFINLLPRCGCTAFENATLQGLCYFLTTHILWLLLTVISFYKIKIFLKNCPHLH